MVEESSPLLPHAQESIEAEPDTALEPEPESGKPAPQPRSETAFVCDCEESLRSACKGLPSYKNGPHCVLHSSLNDKSADFKVAFDRKLNNRDFDFRGVRFPDEVNFSRFAFSEGADFSSATFSADADFRDATFSAGADFRFATFSTDAYFLSATFSADADFISATFRADAGFSSAKFSKVADFSNAAFSKAADFTKATFSAGAYFCPARFSADTKFSNAAFNTLADFSQATFSADADFSSATFIDDAFFNHATFSADADFSYVRFSATSDFTHATFALHATFNSAIFSAAAYFLSAKLSDVDFSFSVFHAQAMFLGASFIDSVHFRGSLPGRTLGNDPSLYFQHVRIENPDRIAFHTLVLRPHWFINVDSRRFVFTDVGWGWDRISIKQEIAAFQAAEAWSSLGYAAMPDEPSARLLAIACRQLAENAEANNRYEEASRFRYWAMDLARRAKWKGWSFWKTDWLHMLYWTVSGYGERILRALSALAVVWIVFAVLYTQAGFKQETMNTSAETAATLADEDSLRSFSRALTYSLAVISLQKPEPKPLTGTAHTLVTLETILGPVQAALLALAIRRKFMR